MQSERIRVLIVDDHPLIRDGLRSRLRRSQQITVAGEAESGEQAISMVEKFSPDVVLMDINMPGMNGIEATEILLERFPDLLLLVLSVHDDREYIMDVLRTGAKGYILKSASASEMLAAIQAVCAGGVYYSPSVAQIIIHQDEKSGEILTAREQTIIRMLAQGNSNKLMARELDISVRTVETHRRNIKKKLNLNTTAALIRYAIDYRLDQ